VGKPNTPKSLILGRKAQFLQAKCRNKKKKTTFAATKQKGKKKNFMKVIPNDDKFKAYCAISHALESVKILYDDSFVQNDKVSIVDDNLIKRLLDAKKYLEQNIIYHLKYAPQSEKVKPTEITKEEIDTYFDNLKKAFYEEWEGKNLNGYEWVEETNHYLLYK